MPLCGLAGFQPIDANRPYLGGTVPLFNAKNLTVPPFFDSVPLFHYPQRCYFVSKRPQIWQF